MDWDDIKEREHSFLDEQLQQVAHKYARYQSAAPDEHCAQAQLAHAAELELALLQELRVRQRRDDSVSLEALILYERRIYAQRAAMLAQRWQRGKPTPAAYWDAEVQCNFLGDLLGRYHEWRAKQTNSRSSRAQNGSGERAHITVTPPAPNKTDGHLVGLFPWYYREAPTRGAESLQAAAPHVSPHHVAPEMLQHDLAEALAALDFPQHHLHVIVQTEGLVILTGILHTTRDCRHAIQTALDVEGVYEVLVDIRIIPSRFCPCCRPPLS